MNFVEKYVSNRNYIVEGFGVEVRGKLGKYLDILRYFVLILFFRFIKKILVIIREYYY